MSKFLIDDYERNKEKVDRDRGGLGDSWGLDIWRIEKWVWWSGDKWYRKKFLYEGEIRLLKWG